MSTYRNSASYRKKQQQWTKDWKKRKIESDPEWAKRQRKKAVVKVMQWARENYRTNTQYRERTKMYGKFHIMFRNLLRMKRNEHVPMIGCTLQELSDHLEQQFSSGMTWDNYGKYWEIDHIDGISMFDLTKKDQALACWHHKNLRPMVKSEHMKKRNGLVLHH